MHSWSVSPSNICFRYVQAMDMYSIQRTWSVFAVALELDFLDVIGVRTEVAAVLLRGWNLTLALLVCAFVTTLDIRDVVHNSPRSFEVGCSVSPKLLSPAIRSTAT